MSEYHTSVLLDESVSALVGSQTDGTYADATFGGGGHTAEILSRLSQNGGVLAFDRDMDAIGNRIDDPRLTLIRSDFRWIHNHVLNRDTKTASTASLQTWECRPISSTQQKEDSHSGTKHLWT